MDTSICSLRQYIHDIVNAAIKKKVTQSSLITEAKVYDIIHIDPTVFTLKLLNV